MNCLATNVSLACAVEWEFLWLGILTAVLAVAFVTLMFWVRRDQGPL